MALTIEDQGLHHMSLLCENHSCGSSKYDYSGESKKMMESLNQKEVKDEVMIKKRYRSQNNISGGEGKDGKCRQSKHEKHIWTERERRKKIRNMLTNLHALLPRLHSKVNKSTIVDEAVNYIKSLQQTLEKLEKQKKERAQSVSSLGLNKGSSNNFSNEMIETSDALSIHMHQPVAFDKTWASSNVVLNTFGNEAQFSICAAHNPGLMTTIAFVMDKYGIEVISANISNMGNGNAYMIQVHGKRTSHHQFPNANSVEEIYKQAVGEIMLWIA